MMTASKPASRSCSDMILNNSAKLVTSLCIIEKLLMNSAQRDMMRLLCDLRDCLICFLSLLRKPQLLAGEVGSRSFADFHSPKYFVLLLYLSIPSPVCFSSCLKYILPPEHHTHNVLISILFIMIALPSSQFFTCIIVYRSFVFIIIHLAFFLVNLGFYSKTGKLCTCHGH